jgi:PAS domain-containing protein
MTSPEPLEPLEPLERQPRGSPSRDAVIAEVLLQATDASCDAWVVFEAIRDETGELDDLRVLHGNPAYWELSGLAPTTALGHGIAELIQPDRRSYSIPAADL